MAMIHSTAIVDPTATVHESVVVGPYCVVGPGVSVGEGTVLHAHVVVQADTIIGRENEIFPFAVVGGDPQDKKYRGERATCVIGDRNRIREHVTIHRGTANGGGVTRIGDDNLLMVAVHIAHDCDVGSETVLANQAMIAGHVKIEDGANIGGGVGVHHFATIGTCAFVGGLARIAKDVPPYMMVEGNPAEVRSINSIGMARRGFGPDEIEAVKDAFKRLYRENGEVMAEKVSQLKRDYAHFESIQRLCRALEAMADGVHGRAMEIQRSDDKRASRVNAASV